MNDIKFFTLAKHDRLLERILYNRIKDNILKFNVPYDFDIEFDDYIYHIKCYIYKDTHYKYNICSYNYSYEILDKRINL